jgi:hypothetical protein
MKDYSPHDPLNMVGEAYEQLVEKTMANLHINETRTDKTIPHTIHRLDYSSIVRTPREKTGQDIPAINSSIAKATLLDIVSHAADQTTLELNRLRNLKRLPDEYHSGEQVNAGTLYCDRCGMPHEMELADLVGKCDNCGNTRFRTQH